MSLAAETATLVGIIPLLWLVLWQWKGFPVGVEWWLLAVAFSVSWMADNAARWVDPWMVSPVYLVGQAWIVGTVFSSRRGTLLLLAVLIAVAIGALFWKGIEGPDILLHTVAWLAVVGIAYPLKQLERLRISLLVYFGFGLLAWYGYAMKPGWATWIAYQLTRLIGILLFCRASLYPSPQLKLSTAR